MRRNAALLSNPTKRQNKQTIHQQQMQLQSNYDQLQAQMQAQQLGITENTLKYHNKNIGEIRHIGLINAMELVTDKEAKTGFDSKLRIGYEIYKKALTHCLLLRPLGNVIYFNPPLNIEDADLDKAVALAKQSINEVLK